MRVCGADRLYRTGSGQSATGRHAARAVGDHLQRAGFAPPRRLRVRTVARRDAIPAGPRDEVALRAGARPRLDPRLHGTGGRAVARPDRAARRLRRRGWLRPGPYCRRTPPAAAGPGAGVGPEARAGPAGRGGYRLPHGRAGPALAAHRRCLRRGPGRPGPHPGRRWPGPAAGHPASEHPLESAGLGAGRLPRRGTARSRRAGTTDQPRCAGFLSARLRHRRPGRQRTGAARPDLGATVSGRRGRGQRASGRPGGSAGGGPRPGHPRGGGRVHDDRTGPGPGHRPGYRERARHRAAQVRPDQHPTPPQHRAAQP
jgi:hypothetical protein